MTATEIEEKKLLATLEQDYCEQILEQKQRMSKEGKRFYTCSICGYQLIILGTTDERWVHTFISTIEYLQEVTKS